MADALGGAVADVAVRGPVLAADLARRVGVADRCDGAVVAFAPDLVVAAVVGRRRPPTPALRRRRRRRGRRARATCSCADGDGFRLATRRRRAAPAAPTAPTSPAPCARSRRARRRRARRSDRALLTADDLAHWSRARARAHQRRPRRRHARRARRHRRVRGRAPAVRRARRLVPGGAAPARRGALPDGGLAQRRAARGVGGRQPRRPPTRSRPAASPRPTAHAPRAPSCETAIQVHGGIGNTWECIVHVYLRRALLSSQWFGDDGEQLARSSQQRPALRSRPDGLP